MIIAIDGHSSCGKSTVAKELAKKLNIIYIDTGAMYRCITLYALQNDMFVDGKLNNEALEEKLPEINIRLEYDSASNCEQTSLNGTNVEEQIRGLEVSNKVSEVSALHFVREKLVEMQRNMAKNQSVVMDGRDIGTVVFPNADLKIFMTASDQVRAQRRYDEYKSKGEEVDFDEVLENIKHRDYIDQNRTESPLKKAENAFVVDNSELTRKEQLNIIIAKLKDMDLA